MCPHTRHGGGSPERGRLVLRNKLLCGSSAAVLVMLSSGAMAADIEIGAGQSQALSATGSPQSVLFTGDGTLNVSAPTADPKPIGPGSYSGYNQTLGYVAYNSGKGITTGTDGTGTVNFQGGSPYTTHLGIDVGASGAGLKEVNINGGTVEIDFNEYHVGTTTIGSTATLDQPTACGTDCNTIHGNLVNNGTLNLRSSDLTINAGPNSSAGDVTTNSGSTVLTTITGDGNTSGAGSINLGRIVASGSVALSSGTTVTPDIASYSAISSGARYILASGGSTATVGNVTATNTGLYTWQVLRGDAASLGQSADDIYLIASKVSLGDLTGRSSLGGIAGGNVASVASVMDGLANSDNAFAQTVNTQLGALATSSPSALGAALKSMAPDVTGGAVQATTSATTAVSNVISNRSDAVRLAMADGQTGVSTGDTLRSLGVWMQPFGFHAIQGVRKGVDGYDVSSGGLAAGIDTQLLDRLRAGFALSYGNTGVDGRSTTSDNSTDIDSYQATLYATYQGSPWYVDTQIGYGYNQYDSKRQAIVGTIDEVAKGDFDGRQLNARLGGGYPIPLGRVVVTPNASLSYIYLTQGAYDETNAPTLGLRVSSYNTHSLKSGVGSKVSTSFDAGSGKLMLEASAAWLHEFHDAAPATSARFAFGGTSFRSEGARQVADAAGLGVGLTYTQGQYSLSLQYDSEIKDKYVGQTGLLKARMEF